MLSLSLRQEARKAKDTKGPLRGPNGDAVGTKCSEEDEKEKHSEGVSFLFFFEQLFLFFFSTTYKARSESGTFAGSAPVERRRGPGLVAVEIGSGDKQAGQLRRQRRSRSADPAPARP